MTREEAAAVLDAIIFGVYPDDDITINKIGIEAVRFAITALRREQEEREMTPEALSKNPCDNCIGPALAISHGYEDMRIKPEVEV